MRYDVRIIAQQGERLLSEIFLHEVSESDATDLAETLTRYGATVTLTANPKA